MNTQAISNGAMHYENARQRFKISKLEMKVKNDHLQVVIQSPLLAKSNYRIAVDQGILRLHIFQAPRFQEAIRLPLSCDLVLPKKEYDAIVEESAAQGSITLKLFASAFQDNQNSA